MESVFGRDSGMKKVMEGLVVRGSGSSGIDQYM